jgi:hypothetical protein
MKNNNNNSNIIILDSYGYVYDANTKMVHPMLKRGGWDVNDEETIFEFIDRVTMDGNQFPIEYAEAIIELGDIDVNFALWFHDGNVILKNGKYSTQDTMYKNALTISELREYFVKQYCDESVRLQWEIKSSGKWIQIFHDLYINIESGYFSNGEEIYDTCIDDANAIEYFEQMSAVDLETLSRYFPRVISKYKDTYTRALCSEIKWRIEEGDYGIALTLVEQISAMTRG